ncbi:MAG: TRAP transporter small permease subunit [Hyphomicrobium aestuarii]|mgnify:CR=1 FL=1|nr:TRAP transporter small permease subunit [Hyphomicrobium aestuarii]
MITLLSASAAIDRLTAAIGRYAAWGVLAACVVAAANAIARKLFGLGSNAWLETQWLLFSAVFLLAAPWTLAVNEHIRIDILTGRLSERRRAWLDLAGHVLFLMPVAAVVVWTSLPFALTSLAQNEGSSNFGGLPQWPLKLLIPIAFGLLLLQAMSQIIKTVAVLAGTVRASPGPASPVGSSPNGEPRS